MGSGTAATTTASHSESLNFLTQLSDQLILGRLVDHCVVLDGFDLPSVTQRRQGLVKVDTCRREGSNHRCLGITAEERLQDHGELALTIGHLLLSGLALSFLCEDTNDTTENGQTLVDVGAFFQTITSCTGRLRTLRARQIDEVDI